MSVMAGTRHIGDGSKGRLRLGTARGRLAYQVSSSSSKNASWGAMAMVRCEDEGTIMNPPSRIRKDDTLWSALADSRYAAARRYVFV